jgi:hypothetical protein
MVARDMSGAQNRRSELAAETKGRNKFVAEEKISLLENRGEEDPWAQINFRRRPFW